MSDIIIRDTIARTVFNRFIYNVYLHTLMQAFLHQGHYYNPIICSDEVNLTHLDSSNLQAKNLLLLCSGNLIPRGDEHKKIGAPSVM
jgi:hypothetical protein